MDVCSILELVRTAFAACGGEEIPPRIRQLADGKAAACTERSRTIAVFIGAAPPLS